MKTIQKIILYTAAGAALLSSVGCKREVDTQYRPEPQIEQKIESPSEAYEESGFFYNQQKALEDLADSSEKFSRQLDATFKAFDEAIRFDKECEEELAKLDKEEAELRNK